MILFKVLQLFRKVLALVLLSTLFSRHQVMAWSKGEAIQNDIDFYNRLEVHQSDNTEYGNERAAHSRGKRFIAFPLGSSFSTAVCMTTGVIGNPVTEYLSMGLNWGIAYDLPNSTWVLQHASRFGSSETGETLSSQIKRRHRRDLYGKLEALINGRTSKMVVCHVLPTLPIFVYSTCLYVYLS